MCSHRRRALAYRSIFLRQANIYPPTIRNCGFCLPIRQEKCTFGMLFVRKSVSSRRLFVRKSVNFGRLFVRKSVSHGQKHLQSTVSLEESRSPSKRLTYRQTSQGGARKYCDKKAKSIAESTAFFPTDPLLASKYAILSALSQPLLIQPLTNRKTLSTLHRSKSTPRNMPFRLPIPQLSSLRR